MDSELQLLARYGQNDCVMVLGRKNWLFAGSDDGGERAAAIYTLIGTAKLNDLNPEGSLRCVLERIADHPINQIEQLLPWNLLAKIPRLRVAA
jgi:transposase